MELKTAVLPARKNKLPAEFGSLSRNIPPDEYGFRIFYVLLTVHLGIILPNNQSDAQFFFLICLSQFSTCFEQHRAHHQENNFINTTSSIRHCVGDRLVCRSGRNSSFPTCLLDGHLHSDVYQMSYWYNWISWWWARCCSKHVENWNKYIRKKELCVKLVIW
jgi:hypothetical protein